MTPPWKDADFAKNTIVSINHEGLGHLIQAFVILKHIKKMHPSFDVKAFCISKTHLNLPQMTQLKLLFPNADIIVIPMDYPKSTASMIEVATFVFSVAVNAFNFMKTIHYKHSPAYLINFFELTFGFTYGIACGPYGVKVINIASQFDILGMRECDNWVDQIRLELLLSCFESGYNVNIPLSLRLSESSIPQIIPSQTTGHKVTEASFIIHSSHLDDIDWVSIEKSGYSFVLFSNFEPVVPKNVTISSICDNIEDYVKQCRGIICSPSRGLPMLAILYDKPTYLFDNPKQSEHPANLTYYVTYHPKVFSHKSVRVFSEWLTEVEMSDQNDLSHSYSKVSEWRDEIHSSIERLVIPYLKPSLDMLSYADNLLFLNNDNFISMDIINSHQRGIIQKEVNKVLAGSNSCSHLINLSRDPPSIVSDSSFIGAIQKVVGCPLRLLSESQYGCWLLQNDDSELTASSTTTTINTAENYHRDIKRVSGGRQFRVIIPIVIENKAELIGSYNGIVTKLDYVAFNVYVLESGKFLHKAGLTFGKKILLIIDYVELNYKVKIDWYGEQRLLGFHYLKEITPIRKNGYIVPFYLSPDRMKLLTKDCLPNNDNFIDLTDRLLRMPNIFHPLPHHQGRKSIGRMIQDLQLDRKASHDSMSQSNGHVPKKVTVLLSPYYTFLSMEELKQIGKILGTYSEQVHVEYDDRILSKPILTDSIYYLTSLVKHFNNFAKSKEHIKLSEFMSDGSKEKKSIVITGSGLIGNLCRDLYKQESYLLTSKNSDIRLLNIFSSTDIDPSKTMDDQIQRSDVGHDIKIIIHTARRMSMNPVEMFYINQKGTLNLLLQSYRRGVKFFIFFSSTVVYDVQDSTSSRDITEESRTVALHRADQYTKDKIIGENMIRKVCRKLNIRYVIFRLSIADAYELNESATVKIFNVLNYLRLSINNWNVNVVSVKKIESTIQYFVNDALKSLITPTIECMNDDIWNQTYNLTEENISYTEYLAKTKKLNPWIHVNLPSRWLPTSLNTLFNRYSSAKLDKIIGQYENSGSISS